MSKIHYFQRYSSIENTVTNNTLQLISRIYNYSTYQASRLLSEITGEDIEIGLEINQQEKGESSIPDGTILQRSFKILIETKVDSPVDQNQIERHASNFSNESQKILLLLTKHETDKNLESLLKKSIANNFPGIIFKALTFKKLCTTISGLFKEYEHEMSALVQDYIEYCNDENLFDQSESLIRIVPCGGSIELNKKYGVYFQPSDRGYTKHKYIGIYSQKIVQSIWKLDSVFDVNYDGVSLTKSLVQGRQTEDYNSSILQIINDAEEILGWDVTTNHRFFCGSPVETYFEKVSFGGIQGARFLNLNEIIGDFSNVKDIAKKLNVKTWE